MMEILIPAITILVSIGGAVFASGKMVGRVCGKVDTNKDNIGRNSHSIELLRTDFERSLNNGIRKDISSINSRLAGIDITIKHLCATDEEFKNAVANMNRIATDVAYIRGKMGKEHPD